MKYFLFIIILIQSIFVRAECLQPVTHLRINEVTPCEGYLFTPEKELEVRQQVINYEQLNLMNNKQKQLIDILQQRMNIQIEQNLLLVDKLQKQEQYEFWKIGSSFALGVIITTIISYGVVHSLK